MLRPADLVLGKGIAMLPFHPGPPMGRCDGEPSLGRLNVR